MRGGLFIVRQLGERQATNTSLDQRGGPTLRPLASGVVRSFVVSRLRLSALVCLAAGFALPLSAGLLVAPGGSDVVVSGSADDAVFGPFSLPFSFVFYGGAPVTQLTLSSNGNVQFGSTDHGFANQPFPNPVAMIAPFWEDFLIPPGDLRYNDTIANQFTVIWNGVGLFAAPGEVTAEAIDAGGGERVRVRRQ